MGPVKWRSMRSITRFSVVCFEDSYLSQARRQSYHRKV
jgi:hypothetical protein